jgi:AcrR family transcriptional regulator
MALGGMIQLGVPTAAHRTPTTRRFQAKREIVLDAAARLFNERGIKGAGLGDIAARVGLVKSGITYYFRKKEDLAAACLLRAIAAAKDLAVDAAREASVARRVEAFLVGHAAQLAAIDRGEHPALIGFSETRSLPDAQAAAVYDAYIDLFRGVRRLLSGPETAALGRDARNARAHLLLSAAHMLPSWTLRCEADEYPRLARRVADILLNGVFGAAQSWPTVAELAARALPEPLSADETTEAFLRAATELVNEHGYRGASVDKIAAMLDATKGKFYHHNDTKEDLVSACFERSFALQRHFLRCAESTAGPNALRVVAAADALVRFQLSARGPLLRGSAYSALPDEQRRLVVQRTTQRLTERIASLLVDGLTDGSVRPLDTALAAEAIAATINAALELRRWVTGVAADNVTRLHLRPAFLGLLCDE